MFVRLCKSNEEAITEIATILDDQGLIQLVQYNVQTVHKR